jgi:hypothetical protein
MFHNHCKQGADARRSPNERGELKKKIRREDK